MRRISGVAKRKDRNHNEVAGRFAAFGCKVADTSSLGDGFPDMVCCRRATGWTFLVEVKDGERKPSERRLNDAEQKFHAEWPGPCFVVEHVDQVPGVLARDPGHDTRR